MELDGRVAIVTGGARGQGAAEARCFAAAGAHVVLTDLRTDEGEAVAAELGGRGTFVRHDVSDESGWSRVVGEAVDRFGHVDVLVNNAGMLRAAPLEDETAADFRRILDVNLVGAFLGMRAVLPAMRDAGRGAIVNVSSVAGLVGFAGHVAYSSSKFGLRGLTRSAAVELGPLGIRVNSVHPGVVDTPMVDAAAVRLGGAAPIGRAATAEEVAAVVLFLATDGARYVTGAEIVVDGGLVAGPAPRPSRR